MLIFEVLGSEPIKKDVDYDLHDDLIYFMNADPEFYRQSYYPVQTNFQKHCSAGKSINPMAFKNVIQKAYESYKKKFPLPQLEEQLSEDQVKDICEKIHSQEIEAYENEKKKQREKK